MSNNDYNSPIPHAPIRRYEVLAVLAMVVCALALAIYNDPTILSDPVPAAANTATPGWQPAAAPAPAYVAR
jgi:hypothetical protein